MAIMGYFKVVSRAMLVPYQRHVRATSANSPKTALKQAIMTTCATREKLSDFCVRKNILWPQHYNLQTFAANSEMNPQKNLRVPNKFYGQNIIICKHLWPIVL